MSQKEFLEELRTALSGKLSAQAVLENIEYYRNYIEGEVRSGKSEAQVLEMLGDPWILARTISDAQDGTDDSIVMNRAAATMVLTEKRPADRTCIFRN